MQNNPTDWHVIRGITGHESEIQAQIMHLGIDAMTPIAPVRRMPHGGRPVIVQRPVWPSYVLCRYEHESQRADILNFVPHVMGWLRFGPYEAIIEGAEVSRVRLMIQTGQPLIPRQQFVQGQKVRVIDGPMKDIVGVFVQMKGDFEFVINLPWFGRSVATPIDRDMVEAA